jgi:hypothetical protein
LQENGSDGHIKGKKPDPERQTSHFLLYVDSRGGKDNMKVEEGETKWAARDCS